jgi:hypothetical protein
MIRLGKFQPRLSQPLVREVVEDRDDHDQGGPDDHDSGQVFFFGFHPTPDEGVEHAEEAEDAVQDALALEEADQDDDEYDEGGKIGEYGQERHGYFSFLMVVVWKLNK